jgi:hypothetical protein
MGPTIPAYITGYMNLSNPAYINGYTDHSVPDLLWKSIPSAPAYITGFFDPVNLPTLMAL